MKMGTIVSPWRYDGGTVQAIRPDNLRRTAMLPTPHGRPFSRFRGWSGYPSIAVISINSGNGAMDQKRTSVLFAEGPSASIKVT
jgi:hypothetical protein